MKASSGVKGRRFAAVAVAGALAAALVPGTVAQAGTQARHVPYAQLLSVSCPSARECLAVGYHTIGSGTSLHPLAERWNGHAWRVLNVSTSLGVLLGVTCPTPSRCVAVGGLSRGPTFRQVPVSAFWNGHAWRLVGTARFPAGNQIGNLGSISCVSPRGCVAVTSNGDAEPVVNTAVETWNGTRWQLGKFIVQSSLNGVACPTLAHCLAVGSFSPASDSWTTFAVARHRRTWPSTPAPPGDNGDLDSNLASVSCATTTDCMAVGLGSGGMLIGQWNGSAWRQLSAPVSGELNGVSCRDTHDCVAVGDDGTHAVAVTWNGTAWGALSPVRPAAPSVLSGVSCFRANDCVAVGYYGTPLRRHTLAERRDGTRWTRLTTPGT